MLEPPLTFGCALCCERSWLRKHRRKDRPSTIGSHGGMRWVDAPAGMAAAAGRPRAGTQRRTMRTPRRQPIPASASLPHAPMAWEMGSRMETTAQHRGGGDSRVGEMKRAPACARAPAGCRRLPHHHAAPLTTALPRVHSYGKPSPILSQGKRSCSCAASQRPSCTTRIAAQGGGEASAGSGAACPSVTLALPCFTTPRLATQHLPARNGCCPQSQPP